MAASPLWVNLVQGYEFDGIPVLSQKPLHGRPCFRDDGPRVREDNPPRRSQFLDVDNTWTLVEDESAGGRDLTHERSIGDL